MCLGETCITKFPILTEQMFGRLSLEERGERLKYVC